MPKTSLTPVPSSDTSLQLKRDKGEGLKLQQTRSRTEGSERALLNQNHYGAARQPGAAEQEQGAIQLSEHPKNALDEAIEEAQAIKDLVSPYYALEILC